MKKYIRSAKKITCNAKDDIYELSNVDTFWDDVANIIGDADYDDWKIKELQRVADARYDELVGGFVPTKWSVTIWGYVFLVDADSKEDAINIAIDEFNRKYADGDPVSLETDAHQISAKPARY